MQRNKTQPANQIPHQKVIYVPEDIWVRIFLIFPPNSWLKCFSLVNKAFCALIKGSDALWLGEKNKINFNLPFIDKKLPVSLQVKAAHWYKLSDSEAYRFFLAKDVWGASFLDINFKKSMLLTGDTVLHLSARHGNLIIVKKLIQAGATVGIQNSKYETPLFLALENKKWDIAQYLIEQGAWYRLGDRYDENKILQIAVENNQRSLAACLLKKGVNTQILRTLQTRAEKAGDIRMACVLAGFYGAWVFDEAINKVTLLSVFAAEGNLSGVKYLVAQGADIHAENEKWETALYLAAQNNHESVISYLISVGARVNQSSIFRGTPLFIAALEGHVNSVNCLIQQGGVIKKLDLSKMNLLDINFLYKNHLISLSKSGVQLMPISKENQNFSAFMINVSMIILLERKIQRLLRKKNERAVLVVRNLTDAIYLDPYKKFYLHVEIWKNSPCAENESQTNWELLSGQMRKDLKNVGVNDLGMFSDSHPNNLLQQYKQIQQLIEQLRKYTLDFPSSQLDSSLSSVMAPKQMSLN